jgi:hypothetical protein
LNPKDYWATLLLGGCYTWDGSPQSGEQYVRTAISLDRTIPNGYSLLAQNLLWQKKLTESIDVVTDMMDQQFTTVETTPDHAEKIIEALTCVKQILGESNQQYQQLVNKAQMKYKSLAQRLKII